MSNLPTRDEWRKQHKIGVDTRCWKMLERLADRINLEAKEHGLCDEYNNVREQINSDFGFQLLPENKRTVTLVVTIANCDDDDDEWLCDQVKECVADRITGWQQCDDVTVKAVP